MPHGQKIDGNFKSIFGLATYKFVSNNFSTLLRRRNGWRSLGKVFFKIKYKVSKMTIIELAHTVLKGSKKELHFKDIAQQAMVIRHLS